MRRPEIAPASPDDIRSFYGRMPDRTIRALAVWHEGRIACVAGVTIEDGAFMVFSDIRDEESFPRSMRWRAARRIMEHIRGWKLPALVTSNPERANSDRFLNALGFSFVKESQGLHIYRL